MNRLVFAALAFAAVAGPAQAASGEPLKECINFSGNHEVSRFGSQYVLVHDGDAYYRLQADHCDKLSMATRVTIQTDKQIDRVCPEGTRIETNAGNCRASKAETIDEATWRRYQRHR